MPTQRLSMRRIREVLGLRHQGLTERCRSNPFASAPAACAAPRRFGWPDGQLVTAPLDRFGL